MCMSERARACKTKCKNTHADLLNLLRSFSLIRTESNKIYSGPFWTVLVARAKQHCIYMLRECLIGCLCVCVCVGFPICIRVTLNEYKFSFSFLISDAISGGSMSQLGRKLWAILNEVDEFSLFLSLSLSSILNLLNVFRYNGSCVVK